MDAILSKTFDWMFVDQSSDRPSFRSWIFDWDLVIMWYFFGFACPALVASMPHAAVYFS